MFRERSNLGMKRERSMLADMGHNPDQVGVNVAVPTDMSGDGSFESMMADAEGKYAAGDYEGSLMAYSAALGAFPDRLEILDGLTKAQTALEQRLANPEPARNNSGTQRVSQGVASTPVPNGNRSPTASNLASVHGANAYAPAGQISRAPSQAFGAPVAAPRAPSQVYGSPAPPIASPSRAFGAPAPAFTPPPPPSQAFGAPPQAYGAPPSVAQSQSPAFSPPPPASRAASQVYGAPPQAFGAQPMVAQPQTPAFSPPPPASRAASQAYGAPPQAFGAPPQAFGAPTPAQRTTSQAFGPPPPAARAPSQANGSPLQTSNSFLAVPNVSGTGSRLSNTQPSKAQTLLSRPITPAARGMDPKIMIVTQIAKIEEDMNQELWDRVQARSEELIQDIRKVPQNKMTNEEKETLLASVYNSLGKADFAMGNMDKALEDHQLALHIAETYDLFDVKTVADEAIGRLHMVLGREASTVWEETIKIDKDITPRHVEMPIPGNLTRTKTIMATEDNPTMVDIAMPATVKAMDAEEMGADEMMKEAEAKSASGDHEGALMLYSAAQTKDPNNKKIVQGLKRAESALQESMAGAMTARAAADKKVRFNKGWAAAGDVEDAPVYFDPEQNAGGLRAFADQKLAEIADDIANGDAGAAQHSCEKFLENFGNMKDDVTLAERFTYLATVHNYLGRALASLGNNYKAVTEHNAALQISERNGLDKVKIETLDLLARIDLSNGDVQEAIGRWSQCLPLCVKDGEKSEIYHKIALAEYGRENYDQVKVNGDKAAATGKKAKSADLQMNAFVIIAMAKAKEGDRVGAVKDYKKALKMEKKINDPERREDIERRIEALEGGDVEEAVALTLEAEAAVAVCLDSQPPSGVTSRASRATSRAPSKEASRKSSRAPSPTRGIVTKSVSDTMCLLQMYLLYTLPEF